MSKSKADIRAEIIEYYECLKPELQESGMRHSTISEPIDFIILDSPDKETLLGIRKWLQRIIDPAFQEVIKVRKMVKPEVWANYKSLGVVGLAEQELLAAAHKKLRIAWRTYGKQTRSSKA